VPQVAAHLAATDGNAMRPEGLPELLAGPGAFLLQQLPQPLRDLLVALPVRGRSGCLGEQGRWAAGLEILEDGAAGMVVAAQVAGDTRGRPAGVREQDHFQAVADLGWQVSPAEGQKFITGCVIKLDADHASL
jgi:hypothetical protein